MSSPELIAKMNLDEKLSLIRGCGMGMNAVNRLGIPSVEMADGPSGIRGGKSTALVAPIALAATWNRKLAEISGDIIGKECRARNIGFILGPGVNIYRLPQNGRNFEYLGEDPYLCSELVVPFIKAIQNHGVIATVKHFAVNNQDYDRHRGNSIVSERALREIYLPAFEAAVKEAKVGSVMTGYNWINGEHASAHKHLIGDILRGEWKFDGIVMTDWGGSYNADLICRHGADLEMPGGKVLNKDKLMPLIELNIVTENDIDQKLQRIINTCERFGVYDYSQGKNLDKGQKQDESVAILVNNGEDSSIGADIDYEDHHKKALEVAREGVILLKNENHILPLSKNQNYKICMVGENSSRMLNSGGGAANVKPYRYTTNHEAFVNALPNSEIKFVDLSPANKMVALDNIPDLDWQYERFSNCELAGAATSTANVNKIYTHSPTFDIDDPKNKERKHSARWTTTYCPQQDQQLYLVLQTALHGRVTINGEVIINAWNRLYLPAVYDDFIENFATNYNFSKGKQYTICVEMKYDKYYGSSETFKFNFGNKPDMSHEYSSIKECDLVLSCVGYNSFREGEAHDRSFELLDADVEIMNSVCALNNNVVVIVNAGGAVNINPWIDKIKGLCYAWYNGQIGGEAVADIITGSYNPSGKLPMSYAKRWEDEATFSNYNAEHNTKVSYNRCIATDFEPAAEYYTEDILIGYRHFDTNNINPLFEFGFGLSYTEFEYSNLCLSTEKLFGADKLVVSLDIKNIGDCAGHEVIQLYIKDQECSYIRPEKELKGFDKIYLEPDQTQKISFVITSESLKYFNPESNKWETGDGLFKILLGASSRDIRLAADFEYFNS